MALAANNLNDLLAVSLRQLDLLALPTLLLLSANARGQVKKRLPLLKLLVRSFA